MTPAKRYSYLVGKDEPCHTAVDRFRRFITDQNFNPTLDDLEEAFSVEAVTNEFFNLYCEKYKQLLVHLEDNPDFVMEAQLHNFTAAQFAKKLMGQIVFLYFLQKKGWLGVGAWPNTMNEKEYKNAYYAKGNKSRELIPKVYLPMGDGTYHLSARALETIFDEDEMVLAQCVKGKPWGSGPHNFMRKLFEVAEKKGANFFDDYLEPLFYNVLNVNRGEQGYDPELHCRIPFLAGGLFEPIDGYEWEHNDFAIPNEIFSNRINNNPRTGDGILDIFDRCNFTMSEDEPMEREVAIDPEMLGKVFENLLEVNDRKAKGAFYTPREIVHYMCQETLINYIKNAINVSEEAVRDFILHGDLMKDEDTVKEKRLGNGEMLISEELYKLDSDGNILVNKLVDMDRALAEVRVADPAVGSGAFPLGMLNEIVRARQNISAYMAITMRPNDIRLMYSMERSPHNLKYETIKNCIYAADIDPSAVDITQLRLWLSLVIDDETNPEATNLFEGHKNPLPLPNLESNILCGNSLMDEFEGVPLVNYSAIIGNLKNNQQINLYQSGFDSILPKLLEVQDKLFRCNETEKKKELLKEISALKEMIVRLQFEGRDDFNVWDRFKESTHLVSKPYVLWQMDFARVFKEKGGFDIVIGNPPYVQMSKVAGTPESYKEYLRRRYGTSGGRLNLYIFMIHLGVELLNCKGVIAYIIPNTILTQDYYTDTRKMLLENHSLLSIVDYSDMPFENAVVENVTIIANKKHLNDYKVNVLKGTSKNIQAYKQIDVKNFKMQKTYAFNINSNELVEKMFTDSAILKDYCNINQAIALKGDKSISVKEEYRPEYYKLLDGRNINKYGIKWGGAYLDYSLERIHSCKRRDIFECDEKLFFRRVSATIIATYDNEQYYALNTLVVVTAKKPIQLKYILALLNSKLMNYIYSNKFKSTKTVFSEIQARSVGELPIKFSTAYENKIIEIVDEILTLKKNNFEYDTTELEKEIDELVYKIYGLNEKEIEIVEKLPIGRKK